MQYALLPTPPATSPTQSTRNVSASDADLSPTGTAIEYGSEDDEEDRIPLLELDRSTTSSRAPSGWISQVVSFDEEEEEEGSDEDQDENQEAWIDYVREQLSALFPDVYRPELVSPPRSSHAPAPTSDAPPAGVHSALVGGPRIVSDASTSGLSAISTQSSDMPMTPLYGDGAHELMVASASGAADNVTRRVLGNVVNVRDEIQAMREEMQRLRGVVGELSEGLRAPGPAIHDPATPRRTDLNIPEEQDVPDSTAEVPSAPQGLHEVSGTTLAARTPLLTSQNAELCAAIIRQLHANASGPNADEAVFETANLQHLLQSLQRGTTGTST